MYIKRDYYSCRVSYDELFLIKDIITLVIDKELIKGDYAKQAKEIRDLINEYL